ncbi:MAG: CBS domain-containing protein [Desulfobaccales bacterium]
MPVIDHRGVLQGLRVRDARRRQVIQLPWQAPLEQVIRYTIKYKVNALLLVDEAQRAVGVVSKTDLMGAYYAGLPLTTPARDIMVGPPLFCRADDTLEAALDVMQARRVHRLYVVEEVPGQAAGVLAYPDIMGLLYRFCHKCERARHRPGASGPGRSLLDSLKVREVMTSGILTYAQTDTLLTVMEGLASHRLGAVLIRGKDRRPIGVVSKTDLILAYKHGVPVTAPAQTVMTSPVQASDHQELLLDALKQMIFADIHRLFVYKEQPENLVGVLALSDVARFRSGTCRACVTSRIRIR